MTTATASAAQPIGKPTFSGFFQRGLEGALIRYRVMAFIVGTMLLLLTVVIIFQAFGYGMKLEEKIVAPIHGYLYLVYLAAAADFGRRDHWRLGRILLVVAAGFVPTLAFFVEHYVYRQIQREWADPKHIAAASAVGGSHAEPPTGHAGTLD